VIVKMRDMRPSFDPSEVTISVGQTVKWQKRGEQCASRYGRSRDGDQGDDVKRPACAATFDSGFMRPGETFSHTLTTPGIYKYVCVAHGASGMIGEVVVKPRKGS